MNDRHEFDDLARRKLEEREFAFNEAAWRDVQRSLATDRDRGGAWILWPLSGAAVLVIGLAIWWNLSDSGEASSVQFSEVPSPKEAATTATQERQETATSSEGVSVGGEKQSERIVPQRSEPGTEAPATPTVHQQQPSATEVTQGAPERSTLAESDRNTISNATAGDAQVGTPIAIAPDVIESAAATDLQTRQDTAIDTTTELTAVPPTPVEDNIPLEAEVAELAPPIEPEAGQNEVQTEGNDSTTTNENAVPAAEEVLQVPAASEEEAAPPVTSPPQATTTESTTTVSNDSTAVASAAASTPPLVDAQSPWEISALGGFFLSTSNYSGGNSAMWKDDVKSLWAPGLGGELMHLGANWGLGAGLHYTTYAEHLKVTERNVSETFTQDTSYFDPVDTMMLFVIDVVQIGGQTYYVTENRDTTINVFVNGTTTSTINRVLVQARDQINRVSYFEIPILLDAHLVQGPWSIGLRGGPTVGLLSGRRGAVPNAALDGYTEFSDQQFREVVFGYTARAYIRYRFSDAWSVGIEPAIRGQLLNGLGDGDLARRTTAFGGLLSVSYRLR